RRRPECNSCPWEYPQLAEFRNDEARTRRAFVEGCGGDQAPGILIMVRQLSGATPASIRTLKAAPSTVQPCCCSRYGLSLPSRYATSMVSYMFWSASMKLVVALESSRRGSEITSSMPRTGLGTLASASAGSYSAASKALAVGSSATGVNRYFGRMSRVALPSFWVRMVCIALPMLAMDSAAPVNRFLWSLWKRALPSLMAG